MSAFITSVRHSAFVDFVDIFIGYRSKQCTWKPSVMATELIRMWISFSTKKLFLRNENLNIFSWYLLKTYAVHTFYTFLFILLYYAVFTLQILLDPFFNILTHMILAVAQYSEQNSMLVVMCCVLQNYLCIIKR